MSGRHSPPPPPPPPPYLFPPLELRHASNNDHNLAGSFHLLLCLYALLSKIPLLKQNS